MGFVHDESHTVEDLQLPDPSHTNLRQPAARRVRRITANFSAFGPSRNNLPQPWVFGRIYF